MSGMAETRGIGAATDTHEDDECIDVERVGWRAEAVSTWDVLYAVVSLVTSRRPVTS